MRLSSFFVALMLTGISRAQQFDFRNYSVDEGLVQSQATAFCQDRFHHLWIATYGGVSRFDGLRFTSFARNQGLPDGFADAVFADRDDRLWIGLHGGVSVYDHGRFYSYPLEHNAAAKFVVSLAQDSAHTVWMISGLRLYGLKAGTKMFTLAGTGRPECTAIGIDGRGVLWAAFFRRGVYSFEANRWQERWRQPASVKPLVIRQFLFGKSSLSAWVVHTGGLFAIGLPQPPPVKATAAVTGNWLSAERIGDSLTWVITDRGLFGNGPDGMKKYGSENGFTDNLPTALFRDHEQNLWVATNGSGIFMYGGSGFRFFGKDQGLKNTVVMCVTGDQRGGILLGTYGAGLVRYDGNSLIPFRIPSPSQAAQRISAFLPRPDGSVWIGTDNGGIWKYAAGGTTRLDNAANGLPFAINSMCNGKDGSVWLATSAGCFYYNGIKATRIPSLTAFCSSVFPLGGDSVLVGAQNGLFVASSRGILLHVEPSLFSGTSVLCAIRRSDSLLVGTTDRGIVILDSKFHRLGSIGTTAGLHSDFIYSMLAGDDGDLWVGTGGGIARINFPGNSPEVIDYSQQSSIAASECNQNAIYQDPRTHDVWIGTTKGAVVYGETRGNASLPDPGILLQSIRLFASNIPAGRFNRGLEGPYSLPVELRLPHNQNQLTFGFAPVSFRNVRSILYQYRMNGLTDSFSSPSPVPFAAYPGLPPGKYRFEVRSYLPHVGVSTNAAAFAFEILPPFYATWWFRLLLGLLLISATYALHRTRLKLALRRQYALYTVRREEQNRIRQKTAEDFHDEMGNRLTRINLLSDILLHKTTGNDEEVSSIAAKIKDNALQLYRGTNDIIWSLKPSSDSLFEVFRRLQDFGTDLFQDTAVTFRTTTVAAEDLAFSLRMDSSRNIIMIFKEAMHNVLKHAQASSATLTLTRDHGIFRIALTDNGRGLFPRVSGNVGQGLANMRMRTERIGGTLKILSPDSEGTRIELSFAVPGRETNDAG